MDTQQNTQTAQPQQQQPVVYFQQPQKKTGLVGILLSCGCISLIFFLICILPLMFFSYIGQSAQNRDQTIQEDMLAELGNKDAKDISKIAVVNISGGITYSVPGTGAAELGATSNNIINQLNKARDDKDISAVIIRFNTPGGEVVAAEPICRAIKSVSQVKPVYSFIDSIGASLGYLLPNCTKYIYARASSTTGSIGVILQAVDVYGILEKFGGKVVFVTNTEGKQKSGRDLFVEGSETYKIYQKMLDETYEYFINTVYEGRRLNNPSVTKNELKSYADGRVFSGLSAKQVKLVDEVGEFEDVIDSIIKKEPILQNKKVQIYEYNVPVNPLSNLLGNANSALKDTTIKSQLEQSTSPKLLMQSGIID